MTSFRILFAYYINNPILKRNRSEFMQNSFQFHQTQSKDCAMHYIRL